MAGPTTTNASKVGLLVVAFVAAVLYAAQFLGADFHRNALIYFVKTSDATGISDGSRVLIAGVPIGKVTDVSLYSPTEARLTVLMDPNRSIPMGSYAVIPTSLTGFGDSFLSVVPPATKIGNLPNGSVITAIRQGPLDTILPNAKTTVATLNQTLLDANKLLSDKKFKDGITQTLQRGQETLTQFAQLAKQTQELMAENRVGITQAVQNATLAIQNVRKGTEMALGILKKGQYQAQATALLNSLNATSQKAQTLVAHLDNFVTDPNLKANLDKTMANAANISEQGKQIASSMQVITQNGQAASANAIALTQQATEVATEAKSLVIKLEGLVDKVEGKFGGLNHKSPVGTITAESDLFHESNPNHWRTDFNLMVPISGRNLYMGVYDAFETNRLNLQLGSQVSKNLIVRYGAYAGKLGLGVNYQLAPNLGLQGDLFDINNPVLDLKAKYNFGRGFIGWFGYDQIFELNRLTLGVGYQN